MTEKQSVNAEAINDKAHKVIEEYLDREFNVAMVPRTMDAIVRSNFGAAGLSRPSPRRTVRLTITYTQPKQVDQLYVNEEALPPLGTLLLLPGDVIVKGMAKRLTICQTKLSLVAGADAAATC